jgi:multimeric flavodoxin WrbA
MERQFGGGAKKLSEVNVGPRLTLDRRRHNVLAAKLFAKAINRHGGDAEILDLPEAGIHGNTHWPMLDDNNYKIADLLSDWLEPSSIRASR